MKRQTVLKGVLRAFLIVILGLISCLDSNAQATDTARVKIENGWIEKMNNKIAIDVSLNNSYEIFEVKTTTNKYVLHPNAPTNLRLKFGYRFVSFGLQFAPNFIPSNGDEDSKGNTKSFGLRTALIFKHWFLNLSYTKVKGYYLENSKDYPPWEQGDPYFQIPELNYTGFAIESGYSNNSKFSIRSLTTQAERQLKSAGSFIPVFNFRHYKLDDQSTGASTQMSSNIEASIGPGYGYTFVINENFYLSLGMLTSIGYLNSKVTTRQSNSKDITKQDDFIFRWDGKSGIGYNGSRFYTGLYANISGTEYKQEFTNAVNHETRVFYHLFVGIRINSPDYLERQMTKIQNKLP